MHTKIFHSLVPFVRVADLFVIRTARKTRINVPTGKSKRPGRRHSRISTNAPQRASRMQCSKMKMGLLCRSKGVGGKGYQSQLSNIDRSLY